MILKRMLKNIMKFSEAYLLALGFAVATYLSNGLYISISSVATKNLFLYFYLTATVAFLVLEVLIIARKTRFRHCDAVYRWFRLISVLLILSCFVLDVMIVSNVTAQITIRFKKVVEALQNHQNGFLTVMLGSLHISQVSYNDAVQLDSVLNAFDFVAFFKSLTVIFAAALSCVAVGEFYFYESGSEVDFESIARHYSVRRKINRTPEDAVKPHSTLACGYTYKPLP